MNEPRLSVKPGDTLTLNESDYKFGVGELRLCVTEVGNVAQLDDGAWLNLRGHELRADGSRLLPDPRRVLVRLRALRTARPGPGRG